MKSLRKMNFKENSVINPQQLNRIKGGYLADLGIISLDLKCSQDIVAHELGHGYRYFSDIEKNDTYGFKVTTPDPALMEKTWSMGEDVDL